MLLLRKLLQQLLLLMLCCLLLSHRNVNYSEDRCLNDAVTPD
jgi:hypothetical protein